MDKKVKIIFHILDVMEGASSLVDPNIIKIDVVENIAERTKIISKMNPKLFKAIIQEKKERGIVGNAQILNPKSNDDYAQLTQAMYIGVSAIFMTSFKTNISVLSALKDNEKKSRYEDESNQCLIEDKNDFNNKLKESWSLFNEALNYFLWGMDQMTTFEGKIPDRIEDMEKLSYPRAEKIFGNK